MKKYSTYSLLLSFFIIFLNSSLFAQDSKDWMDKKLDFNSFAQLNEQVSKAQVFTIQKEWLEKMNQDRPEILELSIPISEDEDLLLKLNSQQLFTEDYQIKTSAGTSVEYNKGAYYNGFVKNNIKSMAAISFFENDIIGVFATLEKGNFVIGKLENEKVGEQDVYVIYNERDLLISLHSECGTADDLNHTENFPLPESPFREAEEIFLEFCTKVNMYLETDYQYYTKLSFNEENVVNHISGLYNVVRELYRNEGIGLEISEIFIWTEPDDYSPNFDALSEFRVLRSSTGFNGDLAQLHSGGLVNSGGVAYLNGLCNLPYSYCQTYLSYNQLPTYSWDVNVTAHELGHNFGSPHTHSCVWNGNNTVIDGCTAIEGSCPDGPIPSDGGTTMSYCHLQNVGINMAKGFGPQPSARIYNYTSTAFCLGSGSGSPLCIELVYQNVSCNGAQDGRIEVLNDNLSTITWDDGTSNTSIENLNEGIYGVTVTDASGTSAEGDVEIVEPGGMELDPFVTNATNETTADGSAFIYLIGGTPPFEIIWPNGFVGTYQGNLLPGTYNIEVVDGSGCSFFGDLIIGNKDEVDPVDPIDPVDPDFVGFRAFPNPNGDGLFTLEVGHNNVEKTEIDIFNELGQQVINGYSLTEKYFAHDFNVPHWANGTYFIRIRYKDECEIIKFIMAQ